MTSLCETVLERFATGDPLSDDEAAHVARCVDCARLARVPRLLATAAQEPAPAPGFSTRMEVGARARLAQRKRRRVAMTGAAAAAVLVAGGLAVTRPADRVTEPAALYTAEELERAPLPPPSTLERPATSAEQLVLHLVRVSDVDAALAPAADWPAIAEPLDPYRALLLREGARKGAPR